MADIHDTREGAAALDARVEEALETCASRSSVTANAVSLLSNFIGCVEKGRGGALDAGDGRAARFALELLERRDRAQAAEIARLSGIVEAQTRKIERLSSIGLALKQQDADTLMALNDWQDRATRAEADRDALLAAFGHEAGPLGKDGDWRRKVILGEAAGMRGAFARAESARDEARRQILTLRDQANREADEMTDRHHADQAALAASEAKGREIRGATYTAMGKLNSAIFRANYIAKWHADPNCDVPASAEKAMSYAQAAKDVLVAALHATLPPADAVPPDTLADNLAGAAFRVVQEAELGLDGLLVSEGSLCALMNELPDSYRARLSADSAFGLQADATPDPEQIRLEGAGALSKQEHDEIWSTGNGEARHG